MIYSIIENDINDCDYGIFGHSMGSLLAYELYHRIVKEGKPKPKHLFFSAHRAPNFKNHKDKIYTLSNEKFINKVIELGGTPKVVLENQELLKIVIPILRSDFKMLEEYVNEEKDEFVDCKVSVFMGKKDSITLEEVQEWNKVVSTNVNIYSFEGGHFFINDEYEKIIKIIEENML